MHKQLRNWKLWSHNCECNLLTTTSSLLFQCPLFNVHMDQMEFSETILADNLYLLCKGTFSHGWTYFCGRREMNDIACKTIMLMHNNHMISRQGVANIHLCTHIHICLHAHHTHPTYTYYHHPHCCFNIYFSMLVWIRQDKIGAEFSTTKYCSDANRHLSIKQPWI